MIRQAVIDQLNSAYPVIEIVTDEAPQGFAEPSFYIKTIIGGQGKDLNTRYTRKQSFDVHYFGEDKDSCESMAVELYDVLDSIGFAKGNNMTYEVIDTVLHFFVDYSIRIDKSVDSSSSMSSLEVNADAKE